MKTFLVQEGPELSVDLYLAQETDPSITKQNCTVIYFHGGGLLFGSRRDLPQTYIDLFLKAGFDFLAVDYPLAPECHLPYILSTNLSTMEWILNTLLPNEGLSSRYVFFGRSAGAYLSLSMANLLRKKEMPLPLGIISFYGYPRLAEQAFLSPSTTYCKYPMVSEKMAFSGVKDHIVTQIPPMERYAMYVYVRQTGKWPEVLFESPEDDLIWSVAEEDLPLLPPCFMTAGSSDEDVPFRFSRDMSRKIPHSRFVPVYYKGHEFDKDPSDEESLEIYRQVIEFLNEIIKETTC